MPYDPAWPQNGQLIDADRFRDQFGGLKDLIDAIQSISSAQVDAVSTLNPGEAATVSLSVTGGVLHVSFGIPRGADGTNEVTTGVLNAAIATTAANVNTLNILSLSPSTEYQPGELMAVLTKLNELITALRR